MRPSPEALEELRAALAAIREQQGVDVPRAAIARLGSLLPEGVGMTVDFDAAAHLGHPMVVLRPVDGPADAIFDVLTPREREVAGLVAAGLRNKDIALALGIRLATVKDHVHHILTKTELDGRAAVAAAWVRLEGR